MILRTIKKTKEKKENSKDWLEATGVGRGTLSFWADTKQPSITGQGGVLGAASKRWVGGEREGGDNKLVGQIYRCVKRADVFIVVFDLS